MKSIPQALIAVVAHILLFGCLSGVFAQEGVITGGYGDASMTDPDVLAAAQFAVKAQSRKQGTAISLVSVQRAEVQVVAGLNWRFDLRVKGVRGKQDVTAVVYRDLRNRYSLTSWEVIRRAGQTSSYQITAIKAMLFYDGKGTFSRDLFSEPAFSLWNTIIGEGDAESPSNSTLVVVEIIGNPSRDEALPSRQVEFTATSGRKVLLKRASRIGLFSDDGKYHAAFWLYDTGCGAVKISARILGQSQASSMTRTIPFACGE